MAIEITEFTDASIIVTPTGVGGGNFGILGFLTNEAGLIPVAERARSYTSLASVGDDWASDSEVYLAAIAFYSQTPAPRDFTVLMSYDVAQAGQVVGGGHDTLLELKNIIAGAFDITVDTNVLNLTGLDFSGAADFDGVATVIDTAIDIALAGTTCEHNGYGFIITSPTTGVTSTISFATEVGTGTTAASLGLLQYQALISDGVDAETPVESLAQILSAGIEFIGLVTHKSFRDVTGQAVGTNTADIADWCEAAKKIFMNTSNDLSTLSSAIATDVASQLKNKTLRYSLTTFSKNPNEYPSASVFGRAASVNFEGIATTITLNLKQMPTVTVEDLSPNEFAVLRSKYASAIVKIGKTVNAYTDSRMASGSWMDTTHGLMWLENRIETDMFNLLYQSGTKIPYTQAGLNLAIARLERSCEAAVRNGLAGPGFLPDGTYLPNGYIVTSVALGDVSSGDKSNRVYNGLGFKMSGAGALHEINISGEFAE